MSTSAFLYCKMSRFGNILPRHISTQQTPVTALFAKRSHDYKRVPLHSKATFKQFSTSTINHQDHKLLNVSYTEIGNLPAAIKTITMMSPKTRNSLSLEMIESIISELNDDGSNGKNEKVRCIVIKGEGKAFSAGHNLKEMTMNEGRDYHAKIFERCNVLMNKIISCPVPVVAAVDGVAAAAGCQVVAMCDIAIATESSR